MTQRNISIREFKDIAYSVAQAVDARVVQICGASTTPNFHVAELSFPAAESVFLLCSRASDWALSSSFSPQDCALAFIDHEAIADTLRRISSAVLLSVCVLCGPATERADFSDKDLEYWRPRNLGEQLFNWWD